MVFVFNMYQYTGRTHERAHMKMATPDCQVGWPRSPFSRQEAQLIRIPNPSVCVPAFVCPPDI